jgi:hypothetical protein
MSHHHLIRSTKQDDRSAHPTWSVRLKRSAKCEIEWEFEGVKPGEYDSATGLAVISATGRSHSARAVFG